MANGNRVRGSSTEPLAQSRPATPGTLAPVAVVHARDPLLTQQFNLFPGLPSPPTVSYHPRLPVEQLCLLWRKKAAPVRGRAGHEDNANAAASVRNSGAVQMSSVLSSEPRGSPEASAMFAWTRWSRGRDVMSSSVHVVGPLP